MKKFLAFFFLCLVAALFFLRTPLLQALLSTLLPHSVTYDKVEWSGARVLFHGLRFQDPGAEFHVERAELSFHPQFKPLYLEMHLTLDQPELQLSSSDEPHAAFPLFLIYPHRFAGVKLHVDQGVLALQDKYFFSFTPGQGKEEIGRFLLSEHLEPMHPPLLEVDLQMEEGGLSASLATQKIQLARLCTLMDAFYPPILQGWRGREGMISMHMGALFSPDFNLRAVRAQFSGHELNLFHPHHRVEVGAKEFSGRLFLPLFSEGGDRLLSELMATLEVKGGNSKKWNPDGTRVEIVRDAEASVACESGKEPTFQLRGTFCKEARDFPFALSGKGEVKEEGTFWTEVELALGSGTPMHAQISFCHPHVGEYLLQANLREMGVQQFSLLSEWLPAHLSSGIVGGKVTLHIQQNKIKQLLFDEIEMRNLAFGFGKIGHLRGEGELTHTSRGWECVRVDLHCEKTDMKLKALELQEAELHLASTSHQIESLLFKGDVAGMPVELNLQKVEEPENGLVGAMIFEGRCKIELGCDLELKPFSSLTELTSSLRPTQGWLHSPIFPMEIVSKFFSGCVLEGQTDLLGTFDEHGIEFSVQSDQLMLHHPAVDVQLAKLGVKDPALLSREGCATVRYIFETGEFFAEIPITEGKVWEKQQGLDLHKLRGSLTLFAQAGNWYMKGEVRGAESALSKDAKLSDLHFDIEGDDKAHTLLLSKGRGILTVENEPLPFTLSEVALQNEKEARGTFDFSIYDEKQEALHFVGRLEEEKGKYTLLIDSDKAHFYQTKLLGTTLKLSQGKLLAMEGNFSIAGKELTQQLKLLQKCGLLPFDPTPFSCEGNIQLAIHFHDLLAFELEGKRVRWKDRSFGYVSAKGSKKGEEWSLEQLKLDEFTFRGRLQFNKSRIAIPQFECQTDAAQMRGEGSYEGEKNLFSGTLREVQLDLAKCGASVKGIVKGKGNISLDLSSGQARGESELELALREPFALVAKSEKKIPFSYAPKGGIQIKNADFFLPAQEMHLKTEQLLLDASMEKLEVKKAQLVATRPLFGSPTWEMKEVVVAKAADKWEAKGTTAFQNQPLFLKLSSSMPRATIQISDSAQSEGLKLQGYMAGGWQWESIRGSLAGLDVDLGHSKKEKDSLLSGSVKVDLRRLSAFFPKEGKELVALLKLGKGYELVGDFALTKTEKPHFQGKFVGHHFECLGFIFENFQAHADLSFDHVRLSHFMMQDPGAKAQIKQVKIDKRASSDQWILDVPLIQFQEVSPSQLKRENQKVSETRPLTIKNFSLSDLRGILNDVSTLSGRGHLNFTNSQKKEQSFLDIPLQFVKDLGLDPSLLVPVYGEIDLELKGSRFLVKDLRNAYSEAKRCEFFLSDEKPSYIDLSGNIHVDIKMKQNVTLKLVEPFTLKVRGTLEKPKLGL